jgi:hypothetical protein
MARTASAAPRARGYGVITLMMLGALLVATGTPDVETLERLTNVGVPDLIARAGMYVLPVAGMVLALILGQVLGKGRSLSVRWGLYAVLGGFAGFFLGLCLNLFAGVPDLIALVSGPLAEPGIVEIVLWSVGAMCLALGLMVGLIGLFGRPAVTAFQIEETDPECVDVRSSERGVFALSGFGMLTLGVACCALAVARQAGEAERLLPVLVAFISGLLSVWPNYALWRRFDEMQRRHVVDGYAVSAIVVTLGGFVWAGLQALGQAPPIDAAGVFVTLIFVQLVATSWVTSSVMGTTTLFGKPA